MSTDEEKRLENIALKSVYDKGMNASGIRYSYKIAKKFLNNGPTLELGPAEGLMTELLCNSSISLTCVDGSETFCELLRAKFPQVNVVNSLFESFNPDIKYSNIILGHVLEHVEDPVFILNLVKQWLLPNGIIFAAVPNARSLHRQAGVIMNILETENSLNEMDLHHGHRRVFDPETFRSIFKKAKLNIDFFGGYLLKPVSNGQIEQYWDDNMINSFMILGERYPDIAGEIYIVASLKSY